MAETDNLIDEARQALRGALPASPEEIAARERDREEREALAALEAESPARRAACGELRTLWHMRRMKSTAELSPAEAASVDLIGERDVELPGSLRDCLEYQ